MILASKIFHLCIMHSGIIIPQTYKTHKPSYEARISLLTIPATSHAIPENDRETNALYGGAVHITKLYSRTRSFLHLVASSSRNFRELCNPEILRASTSPTKFCALEQQLCRSIDSNDAARFPPVSQIPVGLAFMHGSNVSGYLMDIEKSR